MEIKIYLEKFMWKISEHETTNNKTEKTQIKCRLYMCFWCLLFSFIFGLIWENNFMLRCVRRLNYLFGNSPARKLNALKSNLHFLKQAFCKLWNLFICYLLIVWYYYLILEFIEKGTGYSYRDQSVLPSSRQQRLGYSSGYSSR